MLNLIIEIKLIRGTIIMKKTKKIFTGLIVILSLLLINPISANAEWKTSSQGWWYSEANYYATGWRLIDAKWYNFDNNGYMRTGWLKDGISSYYIGSDGAMNTGYQLIGGVTYKFNDSGKLIGKFIGLTKTSDNGRENKTFWWENGNQYIGDWKNNQMDGKGTLIYMNGDKYDGYFVNGVRNGTGTFTWKNGDIYDGEWKADMMNGDGTYTFKNGDVSEGIWENNKLTDHN